jgi:hypothetical protein
VLDTAPSSSSQDQTPIVRWHRGNWARSRVALVTCALVGILAELPILRNRWVFYTDDAATQILPMWYHLGEQVRRGVWPPLLDLDSWMGGNLAVEALFGVWNPVNALVWVFASLMPDLAVAGDIIRIVAFVALALGCYLLCREYGARRWAASVVAVPLPFCGPLFYLDATIWPAALLAFVWIPYLWWATHRMARGATNPVWVFVLGALGVTSGNPYAMLGVCFVLASTLAETLLLQRWRAARWVLGASATIAAVVPLVYAPLVLSSHVTGRSSMVSGNNGMALAPHLGDLVNLSLPHYVPEIPGVHTSAIYFCWFAVPLIPLLDWSLLRRRWRELTGCLVMACAFVLLAIGPGQLWMFRWPLRVLHYGYLALAVLLAVLLSVGLRTDGLRRRTLISGALLVSSCYLAWAANPSSELLRRHAVVLLGLAALSALAVRTYQRLGDGWLATVLHVGTVATFVLQVHWFVAPHSTSPYFYPTSIAEMRAQFAHRYEGEVFQIADTSLLGDPRPGREAWRDLLDGNQYRPAGGHSINAYTGMGFKTFSDALCMSYHGSTCADAYPALWRPTGGTGVALADLLRLDTVVVQRRMIDRPQVPAGWRIHMRDDRVTVLERRLPHPTSDGRVSWASPQLRVNTDTTPDDQHETLAFTRLDNRPARLIFARLSWPGYIATVGQLRVPTRAGPAGLLEVDLPPGDAGRGELRLSWSPPRMRPAAMSAAIGAAGALALGLVQLRQKRCRYRQTRGAAEVPE